jgi:hypothetical protein
VIDGRPSSPQPEDDPTQLGASPDLLLPCGLQQKL